MTSPGWLLQGTLPKPSPISFIWSSLKGLSAAPIVDSFQTRERISTVDDLLLLMVDPSKHTARSPTGAPPMLSTHGKPPPPALNLPGYLPNNPVEYLPERHPLRTGSLMSGHLVRTILGQPLVAERRGRHTPYAETDPYSMRSVTLLLVVLKVLYKVSRFLSVSHIFN